MNKLSLSEKQALNQQRDKANCMGYADAFGMATPTLTHPTSNQQVISPN